MPEKQEVSWCLAIIIIFCEKEVWGTDFFMNLESQFDFNDSDLINCLRC